MKRDRQYSEQERENVLWRITINKFYQLEDLESLIDLREGPECLDEEILKILNRYIEILEEKENRRNQKEK